jgi:hypothetical protein
VFGIKPDGSTTFQVLTMKGSHTLWDIPNRQRVMYEYNNASQLVGMSAMKFRRMTGSIVRSGNYVRLQNDWLVVLEHTKEDI